MVNRVGDLVENPTGYPSGRPCGCPHGAAAGGIVFALVSADTFKIWLPGSIPSRPSFGRRRRPFMWWRLKFVVSGLVLLVTLVWVIEDLFHHLGWQALEIGRAHV